MVKPNHAGPILLSKNSMGEPESAVQLGISLFGMTHLRVKALVCRFRRKSGWSEDVSENVNLGGDGKRFAAPEEKAVIFQGATM